MASWFMIGTFAGGRNAGESTWALWRPGRGASHGVYPYQERSRRIVAKGVAMKAMLLTNHGGPEVLRYGEAPDPTAGPGEVVVDIHAASVNAADYKVRLGSGRSNLRFPYILGRDFSGVVSATGAEVTDLAVGDAVFGVCDQGIEGAYAEKIAIKAAIIAKKPERLGHAEAAALALTSLTALWALEDTAQLKAGETILIQ